MSLSSDLVSAFAKITNDERPTNSEGSTAYGRYVIQGENAYVQIDGSDVLTPVATTTEADNGDRVTVMIKNHKAVVTGNLSDPSASGGRVTALGEKLTSDMKDAVAEILESISNSLLSAEGGYMQFVDQNGAVMTDLSDTSILSGFRIMDTSTVTETTKGWLANKNGIGWSDDGFQTISKVGLDMANGRIYADEIAAGSIISNSFQIGNAMFFNGATGKITFGENVSMSWGNIDDAPLIPNSVSDLLNDKGYIDADTATYISENAIAAASIYANQIVSGVINTSKVQVAGNIYRTEGTYDESNFLIGVNYNDRLQVGSPNSSDYTGSAYYSNGDFNVVTNGSTIEEYAMRVGSDGKVTIDSLGDDAASGNNASYKLVVAGSTGTLYATDTSLSDLVSGSMKVTAVFG